MKTVQFKELVNISFDIHNIIIIDHHWYNGDRFAIPSGGRPDNGIMFLSECDFEYIDPDGSVYDTARRGSIVYSPIGSVYTCRFSLPETHQFDKIADYLINFRLFDEKSGEEFRLADDRLIISPENSARYLDLFEKIASQRRKGTLLRPMIKGLVYELLCTISLELQRSDLMTRRFAPIYPAIKYIRGTDISELDAAGLPALCHLSESCFRRLFTEYYGMPPLKYINSLKIGQAEERLRSGLMTVAEVAESLGFSDTSYFSRFYKRETGRSPRSDMS